MLGIIFIYFIGKFYYKLAEEYNRSKWGFTILGVVSYYVGSFTAGIIAGVLGAFLDWSWMDTMDERILGLIFVPFGIALTYILYQVLKKRWAKQGISEFAAEDTLDGGI